MNRHVKTDFSFYLPVTSDGSPDWNYMDTYMSKMQENASANIDMLAKIAK